MPQIDVAKVVRGAVLVAAVYVGLEAFATWRLAARLVTDSVTPLHGYVRLVAAESYAKMKADAEAKAKATPQPAPVQP